MRIDRSIRRYTGCLAGLGYDSQTDSAYHGDHDMEITFDGVITNADLMEINKIRFYINTLLSRDIRPNQDIASASLKISGDNAVVTHQDKIRDSLDRLLFKPRFPKTKEPIADEGRWGLLAKIRKAKLEKQSVDDSNFHLKWIQGVKLSDGKSIFCVFKIPYLLLFLSQTTLIDVTRSSKLWEAWKDMQINNPNFLLAIPLPVRFVRHSHQSIPPRRLVLICPRLSIKRAWRYWKSLLTKNNLLALYM